MDPDRPQVPPKPTKLSTIPLSPDTTTFPRTLPPSPTSPRIGHKSPIPPARPPRPGDSTSRFTSLQPRNARGDAGGGAERDDRGTFNPGWGLPFPSVQAPVRPRRPQYPDEAVMFDTGRSASMEAKRKGVLFNLPPRDSTDSSEEVVDLATIVKVTSPPAEPPTPSPAISSTSPKRKPVPQFMPSPLLPPTFPSSPNPSTPSVGSRPSFSLDVFPHPPASTSRAIHLDDPSQFRRHSPPLSPRQDDSTISMPIRGSSPPQTSPTSLAAANRLSISGFEALLAKGEAEQASQKSTSPRMDKGKERVVDFEFAPPELPSGMRRRSSAFIDYTPSMDEGLWTGDLGVRGTSTPGLLPPGAGVGEYNSSHVSLDNMLPKSSNTWMSRKRHDTINIPSGGEKREMAQDEATLREQRMHFAFVDYPGWFPRIVQFLYPIFIFFHYPATLFLDYNVIYTLAQIAISPTLPSTTYTAISSRATVNVPKIQPSTAYWVALAVYSLCVFLWGVIICLWLEVGRGYVWLWGRGGTIHVGRVYNGAASFNFACLKSYNYFCFLYRIRLAPFQKKNPLLVSGSTWVDGVLETCSWYSQNWPTVLLLIPRAGISLAVFILYETTVYGAPNSSPTTRDSGYFNPDGTLTGFASGVLLANCSWACYRLVLVLTSFLGLFVLGEPLSQINSSYPSPVLSNDLSSHESEFLQPSWKTRRNRRIRTAILLCSASSPNMSIGTPKSPYDEKRARRREEKEEKRRIELAMRTVDWSTGVDAANTADIGNTQLTPLDSFTPYMVANPQLTTGVSPRSPNPPSRAQWTTFSPDSAGGEGLRSLQAGEEPQSSSRFLVRKGTRSATTSPFMETHPRLATDLEQGRRRSLPSETPAAYASMAPEENSGLGIEHLGETTYYQPVTDDSSPSFTPPQFGAPAPRVTPGPLASTSAYRFAEPPLPAPSPRSSFPPSEDYEVDIPDYSPDEEKLEETFAAEPQFGQLVERGSVSRRLLSEVKKMDEEEQARLMEERRLAAISEVSEETRSESEERLEGPRVPIPRRDSKVDSPVAHTNESGFLLPPFRLSYLSTGGEEEDRRSRSSNNGNGNYDYDDFIDVHARSGDGYDEEGDPVLGSPASGSNGEEMGEVSTPQQSRRSHRSAIMAPSPAGTFGARGRHSSLPSPR